MTALIERRSDAELAALMTNLGGHDLGCLVEAFEAARAHDRPTCFICYTVKGMGLPLQGHKDNHAGLLTPEAGRGLPRDAGRPARAGMGAARGARHARGAMRDYIAGVPFLQGGPRRLKAPRIPRRRRSVSRAQPSMSTQQGFGLIMHDLARSTRRWPTASSPPRPT